MLIHVKLGVPPEFPEVDVDEIARVFPYGQLLPVEISVGGLTFGCGRMRASPSSHWSLRCAFDCV
jgi:uncharacterized protein (TIGR02058 family)